MKTGVAAACRFVRQNENVRFERPDAAPRMESGRYRRKEDDRA